MLSQAAARNLGQKIKECLKADRLQCAATTASNVEGCLAAGEYIEAWCYLKGWCCSAEDQAPKPCPEVLAKQTEERIQLYTALPPPGWAMQFNVDPFNVPDAAPTDSELRAVVGSLRKGRAAGAMGMRAEHLKEWLGDMNREETEDGVEGIGDRWWSFVALLQAVWERGSIPTQMAWMIIVLLPKGGGSYCGIGLRDPIWKVVEKFYGSSIICHQAPQLPPQRTSTQGNRDGHHGGQAATAACVGGSGAPVPDLSGSQKSL
jgi:hypothetical protein